MNTFWLKIAGFVIVVIGLIILVNKFSSSESEPKPEPKTFYDVITEDDKRLRADIESPQTEKTEPIAPTTQPTKSEPTVKAVKPQPEEMTLEDQVQAERLFEMALMQRKVGRLPGMGYKQMVDYCREIIEKYPQSPYAPKARRMLRDIPERYRKQFNITDEEMGI